MKIQASYILNQIRQVKYIYLVTVLGGITVAVDVSKKNLRDICKTAIEKDENAYLNGVYRSDDLVLELWTLGIDE